MAKKFGKTFQNEKAERLAGMKPIRSVDEIVQWYADRGERITRQCVWATHRRAIKKLRCLLRDLDPSKREPDDQAY